VVEQQLFTEADACISGEAGPGLLVLNGKLRDGVSPDQAADALRCEAMLLTENPVSDYELQKVQNKYESTFVYSQYKASDRALSLCHYTWLGETALVNSEPEAYRRVTADDVRRAAARVFRDERENVLVIRKK
jgi:predicted Zn-dependent peptidase